MALVVSLVTLVIVLILGLVVVANFQTVANTFDLGTAGNQTRTDLFANTFTAFDLAAIIPIVAGAGAVIAIVIAYFGMRR